MSLEVIGAVYGSLTVHGLPRPGRRAFGVPPGGAFDIESFTLANVLLGNPPGAECLELAMAQLSVRALGRTDFAWVGAGATQAAITLEPGESFVLATPSRGCRSYLAMAGGVSSPDRVVTGSIISAKGSEGPAGKRSVEPPESLVPRPLRAVAGPQAMSLPFVRFLGTEFKASLRMDRVGVRLDHSGGFEHSIELPSEPSVPGVVQITPSGDPIILGPNGPTIGGYPKIAVVIRADMGLVGQLRPDDPVRFEEVSVETAREIDADHRIRLLGRLSDLQR